MKQKISSVNISLGTNLGDREQNLKTALKKISLFAKLKKKSSIYETEPVGYKDQGMFLNMVVEIETNLTPQKLLAKLNEIEHKMGRNRSHEIKNGPRIIDLDILTYGNEKVNEPNLKIPHPRMNEREFVLKPLKEITK